MWHALRRWPHIAWPFFGTVEARTPACIGRSTYRWRPAIGPALVASYNRACSNGSIVENIEHPAAKSLRALRKLKTRTSWKPRDVCILMMAVMLGVNSSA
ncbi:hypothetical protein [Burkholderia pseudomallei]|uniref:hypothetical protein n=1 Tax=Burkholderia pseudomallei TaxID=28450 RepID=UPI0011C4D72F|nr:hypothetical protein [Burkholderia pseudomallei]